MNRFNIWKPGDKVKVNPRRKSDVAIRHSRGVGVDTIRLADGQIPLLSSRFGFFNHRLIPYK